MPDDRFNDLMLQVYDAVKHHVTTSQSPGWPLTIHADGLPLVTFAPHEVTAFVERRGYVMEMVNTAVRKHLDRYKVPATPYETWFATDGVNQRQTTPTPYETWFTTDTFVDGWLPRAGDAAMKMADDTPAAKEYEAREKSARDTIDNLMTGKLSTSTIKDVKNAADRALNDRNVGRAIR